MILSAATIRRLMPVRPCLERTVRRGMSFGLSLAGYDIRAHIANRGYTGALSTMSPEFGRGIVVPPGVAVLITAVEEFQIPPNVVGFLHNKSTWVRQGLVVPSIVLEPGWNGYLTIAVRNHSIGHLSIFDHDPIAQVVFHELDSEDQAGYRGKYQGQGPEPTPARFE